MTDKNNTNIDTSAETENDTGSGHLVSRRAILGAVLATGGVAAAAGANSNNPQTAIAVGGGPMSDELSGQDITIYEGSFDERPDAGIKRRYFRVNDRDDDDRHGDLYEDTGDEWQLVDLGVGSLSTEDVQDTLNGRPLWSELENKRTVTVDPSGGADYTSIQDAVDENLAYIENGHVIIDLADATYNEDVIVDSFIGTIWSDESSLDTVFSLRFVGNTDTPSNVNGLSFGTRGTQGTVDIAGVMIDRETPVQAEQAGILGLKSRHVAVRDCEFGDITDGVHSYSSYVEVGEIDFGTDLRSALITKHRGEIYNENYTDAGWTPDNLSGTTSAGAYDVQNGVIYAQPESSLSGSPTYDIEHGFIAERGGNVITNGDVKFSRMGAGAVQTIPHDTLAKVEWDTLSDDTLGAADTSNNEMSVLNSAVYRIEAVIRPRQAVDEFATEIHVNGSKEFEIFGGNDGIGAFETQTISRTLGLSSGDTVSIHARAADPNSNDVDINGSNDVTNFEITQLSAQKS